MEKKSKKSEKLKNILLFHHFTLEIFNRGLFLPITKTPKYSTTVLNSVNDTQDFMCIKYKAFLPCKQHPNYQYQQIRGQYYLWNLSPGPASSPAPVFEGEVDRPPAI